MNIYRRLCPDIQRVVASYFLPYERHGISIQSIQCWCRPQKRIYYTRIRRCPPGLLTGYQKSTFYYRRRDRYVQWIIQVTRSVSQQCDIWHIRGFTQFDKYRDPRDKILFRAVGELFKADATTSNTNQIFYHADTVYSSDYCSEICFIVSTGRDEYQHYRLPVQEGGSRQAYLVFFADMVRKLSTHSQELWRSIKRNHGKDRMQD